MFEARELSRHYSTGGGFLRALDGVSFKIFKGETLGVVGESGCGKTTCGRTLIGLYGKTGGSALYCDADVHTLAGEEKRRFKKEVQMVFQDAYSALDPRMTAGDIVSEGPDIHGLTRTRAERAERAVRYLELVGLGGEHLGRYAHEFSGGQRQRVGIARALAVEPQFILLDEPISALDVSIQAQIINLLMDLQKRLGLTYMFIAHDLSVVRLVSDRIAVMYLGSVVELASSAEIYYNALHPYTRALYASVPIPDPELEMRRRADVIGDAADPGLRPESGCKFAPRCKYADGVCRRDAPPLIESDEGHFIACHYPIQNIGAAPGEREMKF
jgi:oligopeptide transport system ATP-binding protein